MLFSLNAGSNSCIDALVRPETQFAVLMNGSPCRRAHSHIGVARIWSSKCRRNDFPDEFAAGIIDPRGVGRARRARDLPQCGEWVLRLAGEGARASRPRYGGRTRR